LRDAGTISALPPKADIVRVCAFSALHVVVKYAAWSTDACQY
jgi:hypothetical protein